MRNYLIILQILSLLFFTTSCAVLTRTKQLPPSTEYQATPTAVVPSGQNEPQFVTISEEPAKQQPTIHHKPEREKQPAVKEERRSDHKPSHKKEPEISIPEFTSRELDHVKFCDEDPFPKGRNDLTINLDELKHKFTYPLPNSRFSSGFGMRGRSFHSGVDLLQEAGTPIYAAMDGVVRISKPYAAYGNIVVIRHTNGLETVYSHNTENLVNVNEIVRSGQQIATVGRTGRATGNHLHFEVRVNGQAINPRLLIDPVACCLQSGTLNISRTSGTIKASNRASGVKEIERPAQPDPDTIIVSSTTTKPSKPSSTSTSSTTKPATLAAYHTVVKGDTLYGISRKHGTSVAAICKLNNIKENTVLALGRKLRIR